MAVATLSGKKWTMRFYGLTTTTSNGLEIVLSYEDGDTMPLSFKLEFPCSNNVAEYEAYLTELAIVLSIGVKHIRVLGDFNLVVSQVKGDFALREQILAKKLRRKKWSRNSRPSVWSTPKEVKTGSLTH